MLKNPVYTGKIVWNRLDFSEAVAEAFKHKDLLARGGLSVVPRDIAGTRFVSQGDARILERVAA